MEKIEKRHFLVPLIGSLLITLLLYRTGGYESWLSFLYLIPIIWASIYISVNAGLAMAIYVGLQYLVMVGFDLYEVIPHFGILPTNIDTFDERVLFVSVAVLFDKLLIFFITVGVISFFVKKIKDQNIQLETEKNKIKGIFDGIEEAVLVVNNKGEVVEMNAAAENVFGISREKLLGNAVQGKLGNKELEEKLMLMDQSDSSSMEFASALMPGEIYAGLLVPLYAKKKIVCRILTCRNVTQTKSMERMKSNFIAFCSHQLRAPLSNLRLYTDDLLSNGAEKLSKESRESLEIMKDQVSRLIKMSNYFLDLATVKAGEYRAESKPTMIDEFVAKIVEEHQTIARDHGYRLSFEIPDVRLPEILLDRMKAEEVIQNVIQNSIKYLKKDDGKIVVAVDQISDSNLKENLKNGWHEGEEISTQLLEGLSQIFPQASIEDNPKKIENWYKVSISDNGIGIPEKEKNKIFSEAYRAENAQSFKGNGIGLFLSKVLMLSARGKICFESIENQGTSFHVLFPAK